VEKKRKQEEKRSKKEEIKKTISLSSFICLERILRKEKKKNLMLYSF